MNLSSGNWIRLEGVDWDKQYLVSKEKKDFKDYYLKRFNALRYHHSDELPDVLAESLIHTDYERYDSLKCRASFIIGLRDDLFGAVWDEVIKEKSLKIWILQFGKYHFNYKKGELTVREEINYCNETLDKIISYIQQDAFQEK